MLNASKIRPEPDYNYWWVVDIYSTCKIPKEKKKVYELKRGLMQPTKTFQSEGSERQLTEVSYIISYKITKKTYSCWDSLSDLNVKLM